jgi:hypothetical protein
MLQRSKRIREKVEKKEKKVETESGKRLNGRSYIIDHTTRLQRLIVIYTMK